MPAVLEVSIDKVVTREEAGGVEDTEGLETREIKGVEEGVVEGQKEVG